MNAIRRFTALPLFHRALLLDLSTCIPTAIVLVAGADALAPLLGLPPALLRNAGWLLVPFALLLTLTLRAPRPARLAAWSVMEINLAWVAASFWVLYGAGLQPTAIGSAVVVVQALAVAGIALLQFIGWRRLGASAERTGPVAARA